MEAPFQNIQLCSERVSFAGKEVFVDFELLNIFPNLLLFFEVADEQVILHL